MQVVSTASPLLLALRERTHAAHQRLDTGLALTTSALTLDRYVTFLRGSLASLRPIEPTLLSFDVLGAEADTRCAAIEADLAALGTSTAIPVATAPRIEAMAEAMGAAYVVEGSSLGGAVLAKAIEPMLQREQAPQATRYLHFHPEPGSSWRDFVRRLSEWERSATRDEWNAACESAADTFAAYTDGFRRVGILGAP